MSYSINNQNKLLTALFRPFLWITEPSSTLKLQKDIRKARLLSSLLLALTLFFLAATILTPENEKIVLGAMVLISISIYIFSRTKYYAIAAVLMVFVFTFFMFMSLQGFQNYSSDRLVSEMKFMSIPLLFGSFCLTFRFMLPFNIIVIAILTQVNRIFPINPNYNYTEGIVFVSIIAVLGLVASAILNKQQQEIDTEREKSESLLRNILPETIAEELKKKGVVEPQNIKEATIIFVDIVGFTSYTAKVDAMELVDLLNNIFTEIDQIVEKYGLEKIKTIGDAYMIAGGVPTPKKTHCIDSANAAIEIVKISNKISEDKSIPLKIRIGIATGPVVAGVIGTKKFIYDIWGDAVNLASRMESTGVPGYIQVTREVAQKLHPQFTLRKRCEIEVKGRGKLMTYILN
jgi:class 3 adenylate cyclase